MSSSTDARTVTMLQEVVLSQKRRIADLEQHLAHARQRISLIEAITVPGSHTIEIWFGLEGPAPTHPALHTTMVVVDGEPAAVPVVNDPPPALAEQYAGAGLRVGGLRIPWVGPVETPPPPDPVQEAQNLVVQRALDWYEAGSPDARRHHQEVLWTEVMRLRQVAREAAHADRPGVRFEVSHDPI